MAENVFPLARKEMEDFAETFVKTSNESTELFAKALAVYQTKSMQDLVQSSLDAFRKNVDSVMQTNTKMINSWTDVVGNPAGK